MKGALAGVMLAFALPSAALSETIKFELEGIDRRFQLFVPDEVDTPLPLVIVLHGAFQTDHGMIRTTNGAWEQIAKRDGIAVAFPDAVHRLWDIGQGAAAASLRTRRDDLAYLDRVIADIQARHPVDETQIFITGFSMGGQLAVAYACNRPNIAAVASVGMPLAEVLMDDCQDATVRPVLFVHGTNDPIVPFAGGEMPSGPNASTPLLSFDDSIAFFAEQAGCRGMDLVQRFDAQDDNARAVFEAGTGCDQAVWSLVVEGMGHRWPGGGPNIPGMMIGPRSDAVDGTAFIWSFFKDTRSP